MVGVVLQDWARKKIRKIEVNPEEVDVVAFYRRTANDYREAAEKNEQRGKKESAAKDYAISAEAFLEIGDRIMYEKMRAKVEQLYSRERDFNGATILFLSSIFFWVGVMCMGLSFTGMSIIEESIVSMNVLGAGFFVVSVAGFLFGVRKMRAGSVLR